MPRKLLVTLILILFLFPFVSWYYLKKGLDYRKEAQEIMSGTKPFPQGEWKDISNKPFTSGQLEGHVSLIAFVPCNDASTFKELLDQFHDQFKETQKANFIVLDSCTAFGNMAHLNKAGWYVIACHDSFTLCNTLKSEWPSSKNFALVDRHKVIRSYYSASTKEEKRILLEHMALLLPRERSEKVELKRGDNK